MALDTRTGSLHNGVVRSQIVNLTNGIGAPTFQTVTYMCRSKIRVSRWGHDNRQ